MTGKSSFGRVANEKFDRPRVDRQSASGAVSGQCDQSPVGQFAHNLVQRRCRHGGSTGFLDLCRGFVDHFDIQIGRAKLHLISFGLDQHIGKYGNCVATFHNGLGLRNGLEKGAAFDADLHTLNSSDLRAETGGTGTLAVPP